MISKEIYQIVNYHNAGQDSSHHNIDIACHRRQESSQVSCMGYLKTKIIEIILKKFSN
jgi:hypothetical protein